MLRIASCGARQSLGRTLTAALFISLSIIVAIGSITFWDVTTLQRYQAASWLGHRSDVQTVTLCRSLTAIEQDITADFLPKTVFDEEVTVTQSTLINWVPAGDQLIAVDILYQLHLMTQDGTGYMVGSGTQMATLDIPRVNVSGKSGAFAANHAVVSDDVARAFKIEVGDTLTLSLIVAKDYTTQGLVGSIVIDEIISGTSRVITGEGTLEIDRLAVAGCTQTA